MKGTIAPAGASRSRRAILAAAAGAAAATAATALARPLDTNADTGDPLILGQENQSTGHTQLNGEFQVIPVFFATNDIDPNDPNRRHNLAAIEAESFFGEGVHGASRGTLGTVSSGVAGVATEAGGVGVSAFNVEHGTALYVSGKTRLVSRSGRATVTAGKSSVDIDLRQKGGLTGTPLCFANLMTYRPGVFVTTVRPNTPVAGKARIYLNRAVSGNTFVAWFILN